MKTTSLELSKQLLEAGFPQESYFYWFKASKPFTNDEWEWVLITKEKQDLEFQRVGRSIASPTAEEILERLPVGISIEKERGDYYIRLDGDGDIIPGNLSGCRGESLAEAAGKQWLYLKEHNLL